MVSLSRPIPSAIIPDSMYWYHQNNEVIEGVAQLRLTTYLRIIRSSQSEQHRISILHV